MTESKFRMEAALEEIIEICRAHRANIHGHPLFNALDIARIAEMAVLKSDEGAK